MSLESDKKEFYVRGRVVQLSAQLEASMIRILLFSCIEQNKNRVEEAITFTGFKYSDKVSSVRAIIKELHRDLFEKYKGVFSKLNKFGDFRARIAHNLITWNQKDLSYFTIWDISTDRDGFEFHHPTRYTIQEFANRIDYFKTKLIPFVILAVEYEDRFKSNYPDVYHLINPEQNN